MRVLMLFMMVFLPLLAVALLLSGIKAQSAQAATTKVGMIFDGPEIDDHGFEWQTYQGLVQAENELGVQGTVYTSTDSLDYVLNVGQCAIDGNDLCIGVGFLFEGPISTAAEIYTNTKFAIVDSTLVNYPPNVRGITFKSEEVGYLAGTLAALMSQSNIIGDLGGLDIPTVVAFTEGYRNGAHCANPEVTTIISYTNDFNNPDLGALYAQGMIDQGADVVFAAAGGTGRGALLATTDLQKWAIGVDTDQWYSVFLTGTVSGSNYLLTSAMKRTDTGVFYTISDVVSGKFTSGTIVYNLAEGGVGLAPFHEADASIPQSVRDQLDLVTRAIVSGMIHPLDPHGTCVGKFWQFLPLTTR